MFYLTFLNIFKICQVVIHLCRCVHGCFVMMEKIGKFLQDVVTEQFTIPFYIVYIHGSQGNSLSQEEYRITNNAVH